MYYNEIDERVFDVAEYVATTGATVRDAARLFGVSKSTVHKDLTGRLKQIAPQLYEKVGEVLAKNRAERHIRGGRATKLKYASAKNNGITQDEQNDFVRVKKSEFQNGLTIVKE